MTPLELIKGDDRQWPQVKKMINNLPAGIPLIARTMRNWKALQANIKTFCRAVTIKLKDPAQGDQFGPLLAGALALVHSGEISEEKAWELGR